MIWQRNAKKPQSLRIGSEQARRSNQDKHAEPTKRARLSKPMTYAMRMSNDIGACDGLESNRRKLEAGQR